LLKPSPMKQSTSKETGKCEAMLFLLNGRLQYRRLWIARWEPSRNAPPTRNGERWILEYDEDFNFAHMGTREVEKEWGVPRPKKPKAKALSPEALRLLTLMRSAALTSAERDGK